ncbi:MAG TPA: NB-ARC domain-containing protein [Myxococcaceae bacterium]|nr:NB-ARC domain-containing protein [Myxococcaceae bacterium]
MPNHPRVFISYSHDSDEHRDRVRQLAARLRADGIDAWIDQYSPAPVEGWPRWMKAEFARAHFIIVVCSPGYAERFDRGPGHGSGAGWEAMLIQQELYEKGGNTRVIPVFFSGEEQAVPTELRRFTRHPLPTAYDALLRHLTGRLAEAPPILGPPPSSSALLTATLQSEGARPGSGVRRIPWNAPPLPDQYLPREELDAFKLSLIATTPQAIAVAGQHHRLGVQGMPGVGKTLLAAALAWDPEVQDAFPGGVFWLTLGRTPDPPLRWQAALAAQLKGAPVEMDTSRLGKAKLAELFAARPPSLLILDDVWRAEDAEPFNAIASPSRLLITTRNRDVASGLGATVRELLELKAAAGLALLAAYADRPVGTLPQVALEIVRECGELPLALAMAGAMLRGRPDDRWPTLLAQLQKADLAYLAAALPDYSEHRSMLAAIEVSVEELPEDVRRRFLDFGVFAEDTAVPERVLQLLWKSDGVELAAAQSTVDALVDRSLVRRDDKGRLTLHDLQHDYVRARGGDIRVRHARLLNAYRNAAPDRALHAVVSDGYFFEHGPEHLLAGEGPDALRDLLFDHRWLAAKLNATGVNALLADSELLDLASDKPLRSLRDALRLSGHVLAWHPEELASQLLGRLRGAPEAELQYLCARINANATSPTLLPIWPRLHPPGEALLRTLEGHTDWVNAVALSADGRVAVSRSRDGALKVWDVETGQQRRTLEGYPGGMALSADGRTAVSGCGDWTLKVWDVETGRERWTLEGHTGWLNAVALSADGKTAVSASDDKTLKVWDVETGQERQTLEGHTGWVSAVALSADGQTAVSGSGDRTLKVWDVETGQERRTVESHPDWVKTVALSADGKTAVSGSGDWTLKVWDAETGQQKRTLEGHTCPVDAVALSADGQTAVSGSGDGILKVWNVETGQQRRTLEDYDWMDAVALSANGKVAISASSGRRLRVWDVEIGREKRISEGHAGPVNAVALSADGQMAISASDDSTLKVWDAETGRVRHTLKGHSLGVNAVALSANGKTAVSASGDWTLKVWDLETGQERRTLEGHTGEVNAVALSSDGKIAISNSISIHDALIAWNVETGQQRWTLASDHVYVVALSTDGKTATFVSDGMLKEWDVETGQERRTLADGRRIWWNPVALDANGKIASSVFSSRSLKVCDVATGQERQTLEGHAGPVNAVVLSADGKMAASGSSDRTLKVWDLEMGACLASFTGEAAFTALALSQSMQIFAGDSAGHVHLLELRLGPDQAPRAALVDAPGQAGTPPE